ncbi:MAG: type VI secretion protein [Gammaproteobacteria bacterium]|nr:type VI secretion protein [Gammaproteobacteria bacterium]
MSGPFEFTVFARHTVLAGMLFLGAPLLSHAEAASPDTLRACSAIDDASARLACYDEAVGRPAPAASTIATPPAETRAEKTLDDLGAETLPGASRAEDEAIAVRATVTGCKKDARKKYMFFFENGQVWRQSSDKRVYFKDCNFDVTISKDFFGYKMQKDGDKGRIRISRIK